VGLLKARLGSKINAQALTYGEKIRVGDVWVSLHSAGHILGSAQVRIQRGREVWVASGDYKRDRDPSCAPFESVACDTFITEATFGTPKFTWPKNQAHGSMIAAWWRKNAENGLNSVLFGYSLGKAQRILAELLAHAPRPVLIHESISVLTDCYRREGVALAETVDLQSAVRHGVIEGALLLTPPAALREDWATLLGEYRTAFASGWMQGCGANSGKGFSRPWSYDHGFVMSDHADWDDLNQTIMETGASQIFVQHRSGALVRHLKRKGLEAYPIQELTPAAIRKADGPNLRLFQGAAF
jgi:putative mRNA 3-end processing factor